MEAMSKKFSLDSMGIEATVGRFARQADGAVWIRSGKNIVLSTAVATKESRDFMGFFPLMVEYREKTAAAGKIPGGYIKREGRLSNFEILASRLIDRPIRPLFPSYYFNEVQLLSTVYSADGGYPTDILALIGSSLSLTISSIPFLSPVGAVRVGRQGGKWTFNLGHEEQSQSEVSLTIAGTKDGISMVEGSCNSLSEEELVDVLFKAHEKIKELVAWQEEIAREIGVAKQTPKESFDWGAWKQHVQQALPENFVEAYFIASKQERNAKIDQIKTDLLAGLDEKMAQDGLSKAHVTFLFDQIVKEALPNEVAKRNERIDGRSFNTIRPITVDTSVLPCAHGSSLFTRGETQALVSVTLGTAQDVQREEMLIGGMNEKKFMLHYNFPPFSTGEVKMVRGVGRREIGHGSLAESSFDFVLPKDEKFPYTIRIISDILESNGSSSMASVCGATMALMDAGVPVSNMVAGIAMGLMKDSNGGFHVLSDILGTEDAFGLMDFKITGTADGIMAVQMDIKEKAGLTREVLAKALEQAREGRLYILGEMRKELTQPREEISEYAPQVIFFKVSPDKIGGIIGPAGKHIKEVIALTGAEIDIEDDGTVKIYAKDATSSHQALGFVKVLAGDIEVGSLFTGKVKRHADFGIFVDMFPGKGGLVHISSIARAKQDTLEKDYPIDSDLKVKVVAHDRETGRIRLVAPDLQDERSRQRS